MKLPFEKPFDRVMKFFTPDLFARFNSDDDAEADLANEDWERALQAYRHHLDALRDRMPSQVQKLAGLCLHDAEILAFDQPIEPLFSPSSPEGFPSWAGFSILSVRQDDQLISLIYVLWDRVRTHQSPEGWPFSRSRAHWLYDEVDVSPQQPGMFLHRVLLSDGSVVEIPFSSALIHRFSLSESPENQTSRQSA